MQVRLEVADTRLCPKFAVLVVRVLWLQSPAQFAVLIATLIPVPEGTSA